MQLAFADALDFNGKLTKGFVRFVKAAFQAGDIVLELPHILLQEEGLPDKFKQRLEHGG